MGRVIIEMPWHYWVLRQFAGATPPREWEDALSHMNGLLTDSLIDKIEAAAFSIREKRRARWMVSSTDKEFSSETESLRVAKKLTWLALHAPGAPTCPVGLTEALRCRRTDQCNKPEGHQGECGSLSGFVTSCPLCLEPLSISDFNRNARKDPAAIQMGHRTPLLSGGNLHRGENVFWSHRRCNYIQGEQDLETAIATLVGIAAKHGPQRSGTPEV